MKKRDSIVN